MTLREPPARPAPESRPLLDRYLAALGLPAEPPSAAALVRLQRAHVQRFAYDSLWRVRGRIPELSGHGMVLSLVDGEGGGCHQLGFAFWWLLVALGYDAHVHRARVKLFMDDDFRAWPQHPVVTVRFGEDTWYADVGQGNGLLDPVPLAAGPILQPGGFSYALERDDRGPSRWTFRHDPSLRGVRELQFDAVVDSSPEEFEDGFGHVVSASATAEGRAVIASRRDPEGVSTLTDDLLVRTEDAHRTRTRLGSAAEWEVVLREEFRLELPGWSRAERDELWAWVTA